jgi:hypothetical protein
LRTVVSDGLGTSEADARAFARFIVSPLLRDSFQLLWPRLWYDHPKYHPRRPASCSNVLRCRMTSSARYVVSSARRVVPSACLGSILIEMEVSSWVVSEVQTAQRESCFVPGKLADRCGWDFYAHNTMLRSDRFNLPIGTASGRGSSCLVASNNADAAFSSST